MIHPFILFIALLCLYTTSALSADTKYDADTVKQQRDHVHEQMKQATYTMEHRSYNDYSTCRDITDEIECNSSKVESFQCVYCKAKAVKSVCVTTAQAQKLPAGMYNCNTILCIYIYIYIYINIIY